MSIAHICVHVLIAALVVLANPPTKLRPIVVWHGMGDAAKGEGMHLLKTKLELAIPNVHVHVIAIGNSVFQDRKASYLDDLNRQVQQVCQDLQLVPELSSGFHAIGFSQGGLFLRALVEQCPDLKIVRLITWASPHQGVSEIPHSWCTNQPLACRVATWALNHGAYLSQVQHSVVQAGYIKIPDQYDTYLTNNLFLPVLNNELVLKSRKYKSQMKKLELMVLVKHTNDTVLNPRDTAWFSELVQQPSGELDLVPVRNTTLYTEDWIGIKSLDRRGNLVFVEVPGDHMQFSVQQFLDICLPYLKPAPSMQFQYQS